MTIQVLIWALAAAVALFLVFRSRAVREALLLVPVSPQEPLPRPPHQLVRFRVRRFHQIDDATAHKPRILLALLFFVLLAVGGKLSIAPATGWGTFLLGLLILSSLGVIFGGGPPNLLSLALLLLLPYAFARWMVWSPKTIGLILGAVVGGTAGMFLFRNYANAFQTKRLEIAFRESQEGRSLSSAGVWWRRVLLASMVLVPLFIVQQLIAYLWPSVQVGPSTGNLELSMGQLSLLALSIGLGVNILFFLAPLFREMLERASLSAASEFSTYVVAVQRLQQGDSDEEGDASALLGTVAGEESGEDVDEESGEEESGEEEEPLLREAAVLQLMTLPPDWTTGDPNNRIKEHLDPDGRWLTFQHQQTFPIVMAVVFLGINALGQTVGNFMQVGVVPNVTFGNGLRLSDWVTIAGGFAFWANLTFVVGLVAFWMRMLARSIAQKADQEMPDEETATINSKLLWQAARHPEMVFFCVRSGTEPAMIPVGASNSNEPRPASSAMVSATADGVPSSGE